MVGWYQYLFFFARICDVSLGTVRIIMVARGPVSILLTVVHKRYVGDVVALMQKINPKAFYTLEDMQYVTERNTCPTLPGERRIIQGLGDNYQKRK